MKVVLFCGGLGMRIRDYADNIPKPMVPIGDRPLIWHLMKYYSHFGHKDFVLCLGSRGDMIKHYFLNYEEALTNDFVLIGGGKRQLLSSDIEDWRITFVDTGLASNIGQRLMAVQEHLAGEEVFLANYADGLSDLPFPEQLAHFQQHDKAASFVCVKPYLSYHAVGAQENGVVTGFRSIVDAGVRVNGGFFIFKQAIFDYMQYGEELVVEPFQRLIKKQQLLAYNYDGFWIAVDTAKEKKHVDDLFAAGHPPWQVWKDSVPSYTRPKQWL